MDRDNTDHYHKHAEYNGAQAEEFHVLYLLDSKLQSRGRARCERVGVTATMRCHLHVYNTGVPRLYTATPIDTNAGSDMALMHWHALQGPVLPGGEHQSEPSASQLPSRSQGLGVIHQLTCHYAMA